MTRDARPLLPTELTLHRALSIARWGSWSWTAVVVAAGGDDLRRPALAWFAVVVAFAVAVAGTGGCDRGHSSRRGWRCAVRTRAGRRRVRARRRRRAGIQ